MPPLKILISGGGCGGTCLAFWLARGGHRVTVVERFPNLRALGAQIDLRAQGIDVVRRMGLIDEVRRHCVDEDGVAFVDSYGRRWGKVMANKSGKGAQSMTSEYEIMRGDLVQLLYDATKDDVEYRFGQSIETFEQDANSVTVHFSNNKIETFDILVGADGQGSRIRKAIYPPDSPDPTRHLGVYTAYYIIPRIETDDNLRDSYGTSGARMIMRRSHNDTESQVYFFLRDASEELRSMPRKSLEEQKQFWSARFADAGWQTDRFVKDMQTTENFYCQEVVQIRPDVLFKDRVVLLGDAANCPSPLTGMGTTSAFVGAYVLAGEINKNGNDLPQAFANYEKQMRPFVETIQEIKPWLLKVMISDYAWVWWVMRAITAVVTYLRIPELIARFSDENKGGWVVPDYGDVKKDR